MTFGTNYKNFSEFEILYKNIHGDLLDDEDDESEFKTLFKLRNEYDIHTNNLKEFSQNKEILLTYINKVYIDQKEYLSYGLIEVLGKIKKPRYCYLQIIKK